MSCDHNWQSNDRLYRGRFRCVVCGLYGYRDKDGEIVTYKGNPPTYINDDTDFSDFPSFYGAVTEGGRCPTLDEQERMLGDWFRGDDEDLDQE